VHELGLRQTVEVSDQTVDLSSESGTGRELGRAVTVVAKAHLPRQVVELRPVQTSFAARRARLRSRASDDGSRGTGRL